MLVSTLPYSTAAAAAAAAAWQKSLDEPSLISTFSLCTRILPGYLVRMCCSFFSRNCTPRTDHDLPHAYQVDHADRTWYQVRVQCAYVQTRAHPGTPMDITTLRDTEAVPIVLDQPCGNWYEVQMMQIREPDTLCVPVCTICSVISSGGSVHYSYCTSII